VGLNIIYRGSRFTKTGGCFPEGPRNFEYRKKNRKHKYIHVERWAMSLGMICFVEQNKNKTVTETNNMGEI